MGRPGSEWQCAQRRTVYKSAIWAFWILCFSICYHKIIVNNKLIQRGNRPIVYFKKANEAVWVPWYLFLISPKIFVTYICDYAALCAFAGSKDESWLALEVANTAIKNRSTLVEHSCVMYITHAIVNIDNLHCLVTLSGYIGTGWDTGKYMLVSVLIKILKRGYKAVSMEGQVHERGK